MLEASLVRFVYCSKPHACTRVHNLEMVSGNEVVTKVVAEVLREGFQEMGASYTYCSNSHIENLRNLQGIMTV